MTFVFNRNYRDHDQVAEYMSAFLKVHAEIVAADEYPYDDAFVGRIPGIEGPNEMTAIYLLQEAKRLQELDEKIAAHLEAGFEPIETVDTITKFETIVEYGFYTGGTGWQEWHDARLVPQKNKSLAVLPKGRRVNGHSLSGKLLVKR
jgi:hypothetical protein